MAKEKDGKPYEFEINVFEYDIPYDLLILISRFKKLKIKRFIVLKSLIEDPQLP